jgi:hypothetical protein
LSINTAKSFLGLKRRMIKKLRWNWIYSN